MGNVLKAECSVTERVQQRTQPPEGLQSAGGDAYLALFFLVHVGRAAFNGVGVGAVCDGISAHDDAQGQYEVIEQSICLHFFEQFTANGKQLACRTYC